MIAQHKNTILRPILGLALGFAMVAAALCTGCNTTEGVGKDIKAAGRGIEKAADANK